MMQKKTPTISIIGLGYVGSSLVTLLSKNNVVKCFDINEDKTNKIQNKISPVKDSLIDKYLKEEDLNINVCSSLKDACHKSDFIILCLPTDYIENENKLNTKILEDVIYQALKLNSKALVVIKSTIPFGFTQYISKKLNTNRVIFSPEFLREGFALFDNLYPSRIIVGGKCKRSKEFLKIMRNASINNTKNSFMLDSREAELIKLTANTYLASRIAFFNEIDTFCYENNINMKAVIDGVCSDERIGNIYNNPSFGYGGYCLPKDSKQLIGILKNTPSSLISSISLSNDNRLRYFVNKITQAKPETIGFYLLGSKKNSDNFRESISIKMIQLLRDTFSNIFIYEPSIKSQSYDGIKVINNLETFKKQSMIIIANRTSEELDDVKDKVLSRDIFQKD